MRAPAQTGAALAAGVTSTSSSTHAAAVALAPAALGTGWRPDPFLLVAVVAAGALYAWLVARCVRAGVWRSANGWRVASFAGGMLLASAALVSPLDGLARAVVTAHMVQYVLLNAVAPPLLVAGAAIPGFRAVLRPGPAARPALDRLRQVWLGSVWPVLARPLVVAGIDAALLIVWHIPSVYAAGIQDNAVHVVELLTFVGGGLLFWRVIEQPRAAGRPRHLGTLAAIVLTSLLASGWGLVMFSSVSVWYPVQARTAAAWGATPAQDQRMAAAVLAVGPDILDAGSFLWVLALWLRKVDEEQAQRERERDRWAAQIG